MKTGRNGKDNGLKKPYRKPLVDSRESKTGVYGDYGRDERFTGGGDNGPGSGPVGRPGRDHGGLGL
jgi:hypothetical protein